MCIRDSDGTLVASYTDPNLSGGQLGVVGHFSNATFQSLNKGELTSGFDSNLTGWPEATGTWSITDEGLIGQNAGLMNQFFLSGTSVSPDDSFTYDGDITPVSYTHLDVYKRQLQDISKASGGDNSTLGAFPLDDRIESRRCV